MDQQSITNVVLRAVRAYNEQIRADQPRIPESGDAALFGRNGTIDSMGLVSLIVMIEEQLEDEFGVTVAIADEKAVSQERSPFRSVNTLVAYISKLLSETTPV